MPPVKFSFTVSLVISFLFLLITFWIFYKYSWSAEAAKDALSTTGSYFGAAATLGAAIIAAYLFNDWKLQHNKVVEKELAWDVVQKFDAADLHLSQFKESFQLYKIKCNFINEMPDDEFNNLDNELNGILSSLNGLPLKFGSYLESLRKYSVVVENNYFEDNKEHVRDINYRLLKLIYCKGKFPDSMPYIDELINEIIPFVINIEENNINVLLKELKAP